MKSSLAAHISIVRIGSSEVVWMLHSGKTKGYSLETSETYVSKSVWRSLSGSCRRRVWGTTLIWESMEGLGKYFHITMATPSF